jgi:hypothetical protein
LQDSNEDRRSSNFDACEVIFAMEFPVPEKKDKTLRTLDEGQVDDSVFSD